MLIKDTELINGVHENLLSITEETDKDMVDICIDNLIDFLNSNNSIMERNSPEYRNFMIKLIREVDIDDILRFFATYSVNFNFNSIDEFFVALKKDPVKTKDFINHAVFNK